MPDYNLVQSVTYKGKNLPPEWIASATYIETMDLGGPKLIILFNDVDATAQDLAEIKEQEDALDLEIADPKDRDQTFIKERFVIERVNSKENGFLRLDCLAEPISKLKRPAKNCTIYEAGSPTDIASKIIGTTVNGSSFPGVRDQHLLPGMRPSRLLRKLCAEAGARLFYVRGEWKMISIADLFASQPVAKYHHNKAFTDRAMTDALYLGEQQNSREIAETRFSGFSDINGPIADGKGRVVFTGLSEQQELKNMGRVLVPELDFKVRHLPDAALKPAEMLEFEWHRVGSAQAPIDESKPDKGLIGVIAHHVQGNQYTQRLNTIKELV